MNLYLIRHAHAGQRSRDGGSDADRPLSAAGHAQADDITAALGSQPITRVVSSPALRCQQTVAGLAHQRGVTVEVADALREGTPVAAGRALLDDLLRDGVDAVVCGHGDLLPELLDGFRRDGVPVDGRGCAKGSVWHVVADAGTVTGATYHPHPEPGIVTVR